MTILLLSIVSSLVFTVLAHQQPESPSSICTGESEWSAHPALCRILQGLHENEAFVFQELQEFAEASGWLVDLSMSHETSSQRDVLTPIYDPNDRLEASQVRDSMATALRHKRALSHSASSLAATQLPVVLAHGMGDSCFNNGMIGVTNVISQWLGNVYTVCIPTGSTLEEDTKNGYFLNMDASVDVFASKIAQDPALSNGFHAIGFSQGNSVIRGYIAKYNSPTVHTFISVNGVNAGIGAVPYCRPSSLSARFPSVCDLLMEQASNAAYTEFAQEHSFQANYWRDPRPSARDTYRALSQLAVWNNEVLDGKPLNETLRENWSKTSAFVWILADDDQMVWPAQGEQWGAPDPNDPFQRILPMEETEWYTMDLFGLKTASLAGKNYFESFPGDHLQFSIDDLQMWVTTYFKV